MKKFLYIFLCLFALSFTKESQAQNAFKGRIIELVGKDSLGIAGVSVFWLGTQLGTQTDTAGYFTLAFHNSQRKLVISYLGAAKDTLDIAPNAAPLLFLLKNEQLGEVEILGELGSSYIDYLNPLKTEVITEKELFKAACCNLSESFETNPSVDVQFTDAVTGTRQIQMLGLDGKYTQITTEMSPFVRGLSASSGMTFIPGTWIESIQITKGIGPVKNGFETITGAINVELKEPNESDKLYVNGYANQNGRLEFNLNSAKKLNDRLSSLALIHVSGRPVAQDMNMDMFVDVPTGAQYNLINRWKYLGKKGFVGQWGVKYLYDSRLGGTMDFNHKEGASNEHHSYGFHFKNKRAELFGKTGWVSESKPYKSLGIIYSFVNHQQASLLGHRNHDGTQNTAAMNLIYQTIISSKKHQIATGASYVFDQLSENFDSTAFSRQEATAGVFAEYTYSKCPTFDMILGLRADYNSLYGLFYTPRIHLRYSPWTGTTFRASYGRGQRTSNIFSENISYFASSRSYVIYPSNAKGAYGLNPEVAWNFGISWVQDFDLFGGESTFSVEYYRTDFQNQVVVDLDASPQLVRFYNLEGKSYSNSFQVEWTYMPIKRLELRMAYRYLNVQTDYKYLGMLSKPFTAPHRAFVNLSYETESKWKFNFTLQWYDKKRMPSTWSNPTEYQLGNFSPAYFYGHGQVTKSINKRWDVYVGIENAFNFTQKNPILAADDPHSNYFDASYVWGPIQGRMFYGGFRYRIK